MEIKEKILKIALELFIERGFLEVSINDLIKEMSITRRDFNHYFKSKDQVMCEAMEKFVFPCFDDIARITNEYNGLPKKKLSKIFQKYSEVESYLKHNLSIDKINYRLIIFLTIDGIKKYESMTKYIVDFNNKLLKEIECIIEEGKRLGEILSTVDSKSIAIYTLSSLQSALVLWGMNQNIDINVLFKTNFKYLWNSIKSSEAYPYLYKNKDFYKSNNQRVYDFHMISLNFKKNKSRFFMSIPYC